ncbi:MAG: acetyltransferase [Bacteroidota bacterium]|jgi:sugar O-acyltransferase (sialic acid O-acetyltransferase NeuD family)
MENPKAHSIQSQRVIIVGSSGHAKVLVDIFEKDGGFEILGFIDSYRSKGEKTLGYEVLGNEESLPKMLAEHAGCKVFIAVGDNWTRKLIYDRLRALVPSLEFASAVHPSAQIGKDVTIGIGVAIMAGAVINSCTEVGNFAIINTNASLDHDSRMGEFSSLAPGVTTGGGVVIGAFSAIGIGATLSHRITVGAHTVIGAGSLLLDSCGDQELLFGVPAKAIRSRAIGEKYL